LKFGVVRALEHAVADIKSKGSSYNNWQGLVHKIHGVKHKVCFLLTMLSLHFFSFSFRLVILITISFNFKTIFCYFFYTLYAPSCFMSMYGVSTKVHNPETSKTVWFNMTLLNYSFPSSVLVCFHGWVMEVGSHLVILSSLHYVSKISLSIIIFSYN